MVVTDKLKALRIKANLIADQTVGLMDIRTEVHDGTAILSGEVESEEQKRTAEELAYEIEGIDEVRNDLEVRPVSQQSPMCEGPNAHLGLGAMEGSFGDTIFSLSGGYAAPGPGVPASEQFPGEFTDEQIEEEVHERLTSQHDVDASRVRAISHKQVVYLKGTVRTPEELYTLQDLVLNTRGVMGVCSEVSVQEGEIGTPIDEA